MDFPLLLIVIIIALALIFDFINGFHDAANSIATIVSTKVLSPFQAVLWAALWSFAAFFFASIRYRRILMVIGNTIAKTVNENFIYLRSDFFRTYRGDFLELTYLVVRYSFIIITYLIGGFLGAALMHAFVLDYQAVSLAHPDFILLEEN